MMNRSSENVVFICDLKHIINAAWRIEMAYSIDCVYTQHSMGDRLKLTFPEMDKSELRV